MFSPDCPTRISGIPTTSMPCCRIRNPLISVNNIAYRNRLNPFLDANVNCVVDLSSATVKNVDFSMVASSDHHTGTIVEGYISRPALAVRYAEGLEPLCARKLVERYALRYVV